ncbi:MAG: hypothetical protein IPP32_12665 [Bacteroidetes bacterium]|nr:hypothetical protein [Bacteroidota bacterium]
MKKINHLLIALLLSLAGISNAQISILSSGINSYNVTPQSIVQINVMNNDAETMVFLESKIFNSANELLLNLKTQPFLLRKGMNSLSGFKFQFSNVDYSSSKQAEYIKNTHTLPSGKYNACYTLIQLGGEPGDEYCIDLESDISSFLTLISPMDKDTIDTPNPMLVWTHSEPFNLLAPGEYFRMLVTDLLSDQSTEAGVITNTPLFMKNYMTSHQLLYPYDAKELQPGKHYAWQVQKISNGIIIAKSEAWEFVLAKEKVKSDMKYVRLKKSLDPGYYYAENNKVFFVFDEEYTSDKIQCSIYDDRMKEIKPTTKTDSENPKIDLKEFGFNKFCIDLNDLKIKSGFYTLSIKNSKNETFLLRFLAP